MIKDDNLLFFKVLLLVINDIMKNYSKEKTKDYKMK